MSPDLERKIDAEVTRMVRDAYQRAVSVLVRWRYIAELAVGLLSRTHDAPSLRVV